MPLIATRHEANAASATSVQAPASGALSSCLGLDDLFRIHERVAPQHQGVPEPVVLGTIVLPAAPYPIIFRREMLRARSRWLLLALSFLAASILLDTLLASRAWGLKGWTYIFEDGSERVGIVFWCGFAVTRCRADLLALRHEHAH